MALPDLHTVAITSAAISGAGGTFEGSALEWMGGTGSDYSAVFGVDGTPDGATFTLQWRRSSSGTWQDVKSLDYSGSVVLQAITPLPPGEVRVTATGGSGSVSATPFLTR